MAEARYTSQFAVVGTEQTGDVIKLIKSWTHDDKSVTVRAALDEAFGMEDGRFVEGDTTEWVATRFIRKTRPDFQPPAEV